MEIEIGTRDRGRYQETIKKGKNRRNSSEQMKE
jgi:hypothetical protein